MIAALLLAAHSSAATISAEFNSEADIPITAASYTASGNDLSISLGFAPVVGTNLTVVRNTGRDFIQGRFGNLQQGQRITLGFAGINYPFVANYFGGSGNDLELQWANSRLLAWGENTYGQLGDGSTKPRLVPTAVDMKEVLKGKVISSISTGDSHSLALCADGTLASWGNYSNGQLGAGSMSTAQRIPIQINGYGTLAGKTAIAISAGYGHSLALCSDGTLSSWGFNSTGQLGNGQGTTYASLVPTLVDRSGVLAGRRLMAVASGMLHNLTLCTDGSMQAWGYNEYGQLGNGTIVNSHVPSGVTFPALLAGKQVTSIKSRGTSNLVLCSDGTLASWGSNTNGRLGNNSTTHSRTPVLVDRSGVLAGKTVVAIDHGDGHGIVLCSDGTLATWGFNAFGGLGNNTTFDSLVPVQVVNTGVLAGKNVSRVFAGSAFSFALCSDGTLASWGYNNTGQLGNNSTANRSVPVMVDSSSLRVGERFVNVFAGLNHSLAVVASPPEAIALTQLATDITDTGAVLNGTVDAEGSNTGCVFEYGLTTAYGSTVPASPATMDGIAAAPATALISGLLPGTTYHYRIVASGGGGTVVGEDMTFTTSTFACLSGLELGQGTLFPDFTGSNPNYFATVSFPTAEMSVNPVALNPTSTVRINGVVVDGPGGKNIDLAVGLNEILIEIAAADGVNRLTYTITVSRLPEVFTFNSVSDVPVTCGEMMASGHTAAFSLGFFPPIGCILTVINNTGEQSIRGYFDNLSHGQIVNLSYSGITYPFIADYYGGTGNDLVLRWANTRLFAWGYNAYGQLGDNTTTNGKVPLPVNTGSLQGRRIVKIDTGSIFSLALCSDGSLHAWGYNLNGQLGNGQISNSRIPVLVNQTGVLAGKTIVDFSAGTDHSVVLCSDGTLAAWGSNSNGQLGNGGTSQSRVPVFVDQSGVLAGRKVIAVAAGSSHTLVLCHDGRVVTWGRNSAGQLGNGGDFNSSIQLPVPVIENGAWSGKKITAISAGTSHNLALCEDGTVIAWGANQSGQLGTGNTTSSAEPVLVSASGVLAGRTAVAIAAASNNSMVLCSDGTIATFGNNSSGQLGNGATVQSTVPVMVSKSGALSGKSVTAIMAGGSYCMAGLDNGYLASWGINNNYQLGNNSTVNSSLPVAVNTSALRPGERFMSVAGSGHNLALVAYPPLPAVVTRAAMQIQQTGATLNGTVNAAGGSVTISFEYGLTTSYGNVVSSSPATASGTAPVMAAGTLTGLAANTTYHYRLVATNPLGSTVGEDMTFTTSQPPIFSGYAIATAFEKPVSISLRKLLAKAIDPDGDVVTVFAADSPSVMGGAVVVQESGIFYTPPAGYSGTDRFDVTITDRWGASTIGTVTVTVGNAPTLGGLTSNPPKIILLPAGRIGLEFRGIPSRTYQIQRSGDLATWTTIASVTAGQSGEIVHTDENPPQPSAYYRLAVP